MSSAGWDVGFIKGHMTGHFLSAAARMAAATGDATFKTKANYMVTELAKCQAALGKGYLSAFPSTAFDWLEGTSTNDGGITGSTKSSIAYQRKTGPAPASRR